MVDGHPHVAPTFSMFFFALSVLPRPVAGSQFHKHACVFLKDTGYECACSEELSVTLRDFLVDHSL